MEIAELVLACEDLGGPQASSELFEADPLTIGKVAEYFWFPGACRRTSSRGSTLARG